MKIKDRVSLIIRAFEFNSISSEEAVQTLISYIKGKIEYYAWYGFVIGMIVGSTIVKIVAHI